MSQSTCEPAYSAYKDTIVPYDSKHTPITTYEGIYIPSTDTTQQDKITPSHTANELHTANKVYQYSPNSDLTIELSYNSTTVHYEIHQLVLKESSAYFAGFLKTYTDTDYIKLPTPFYWSEIELHQFFQLLYTPEILDVFNETDWTASDNIDYKKVQIDKIGSTNLATLLKMALYFDCKELSERLINILCDYVIVHHIEHALQLYCIANTYNIKNLKTACFERMTEFGHPREWLDVSDELLAPCELTTMLHVTKYFVRHGTFEGEQY